MPERAHKHCSVAVDTRQGPMLVELRLPSEATIAEALAQARSQLPAAQCDAGLDWDHAATGIWGVRRERSAVPRDGDRIELYRPLGADPRVRRRQRAGAAPRRV